MGWRLQVVAVTAVTVLVAGCVAAAATPRGSARAAAVRDVERHLRSFTLPAGAYR